MAGPGATSLSSAHIISPIGHKSMPDKKKLGSTDRLCLLQCECTGPYPSRSCRRSAQKQTNLEITNRTTTAHTLATRWPQERLSRSEPTILSECPGAALAELPGSSVGCPVMDCPLTLSKSNLLGFNPCRWRFVLGPQSAATSPRSSRRHICAGA